MVILDYPSSYYIGFQETGSINMYNRIDLYNIYIWYGVFILILVLFTLVFTFLLKDLYKDLIFLNIKLDLDNIIEIVYTILPSILLIILFLPSMRLIYLLENISYVNTYINIIGYQWYWVYSIMEYASIDIEITTYTISDSNILLENYLELDNLICLPSHLKIKGLYTGGDVIHSFGVSSLGVKVDCIPGRINSSYLFVYRNGIYSGFCSELCGAYHNNMNILIYVMDYQYYIIYLIGLRLT